MTTIVQRRAHERSKYQRLARRGWYGSTNHGAGAVATVLGWRPRFVVDFGCGRNQFILDLRRLGVDGLGIDFAMPEADVRAPMHATTLAGRISDVVTSFDALEHLLPEEVDAVLGEMARVAVPGGRFCLSICTRSSDNTIDGEGLHPTVEPIDWWLGRIARVGFVESSGRYLTGAFHV